MDDEKILKKIAVIINGYSASGNKTRARRQLQILKVNTMKEKGLGQQLDELLEKIEIAKRII